MEIKFWISNNFLLFWLPHNRKMMKLLRWDPSPLLTLVTGWLWLSISQWCHSGVTGVTLLMWTSAWFTYLLFVLQWSLRFSYWSCKNPWERLCLQRLWNPSNFSNICTVRPLIVWKVWRWRHKSNVNQESWAESGYSNLVISPR